MNTKNPLVLLSLRAKKLRATLLANAKILLHEDLRLDLNVSETAGKCRKNNRVRKISTSED